MSSITTSTTTTAKMTLKTLSDAVIDQKINGLKTAIHIPSTPTVSHNHKTTQTNEMTSFKISNGVFKFH
jgi:hypothetical protein